MKRYRITLEGQTYTVAVLSDPRRSPVQVEVDGETFSIEVTDVRGAQEQQQEEDVSPTHFAAVVPRQSQSSSSTGYESIRCSAAISAGRKAVTAPLPGVVKSIDVQPGQVVAIGDPLLTIEAMKMDNVVRATRAGEIETIHVVEGQQVAHGAALVDYKSG